MTRQITSTTGKSGEPTGAETGRGRFARRAAWWTASACAAGLVLAGARLIGASGENLISDSDHRERGCSEATIRGDYGIQIQGTRPAPGGLTESVIGVVLRTYDGRGNIEQVDNVKGSITGITPDRQGFGTYEVHSDCTGIARFQPAPGVLIEERLVIVDNGREIRTMTLSPPAIMVVGIHQRVRNR